MKNTQFALFMVLNGRATEALTFYQEAFAGDILFKLNKIEEAVDMWKKAYELDQQNDQIKLKIERRKSND